MKKLFTITVAFVLIAVSSIQAQKLGHVNKQDILAKMPAVAEAKKKLEVFGKQLEDQQNELKKEFETKYNAYLAIKDDPKSSKTTLSLKEDELKSLQERFQKFQGTANEEFQKEQEKVMKPVIDKLEAAIKGVATEGKYAYIFDTSLGAIAYAQESDDITPQLKKKLGIQ